MEEGGCFVPFVRNEVVTSHGIRWAVEDRCGEATGESTAAILVHGAVANIRAWDGLRDELHDLDPSDGAIARPCVRTVAVDLPCHGWTEGGELDIDLCARGVVAIADALGLSNPFLIGHSFGGLVVAAAAARSRARFAGVMVLDPYLSNAGQRGGHDRMEETLAEVEAAGWPFADTVTVDEAVDAFLDTTGIGGDRVEGWTNILHRGYRPNPAGTGVTFRPRQEDNLRAISTNWGFDIDGVFDAIAVPLAVVLAVGDLASSFDQTAADLRRPPAAAIESRRRASALPTTIIEMSCPHDIPGTAAAELAGVVSKWITASSSERL
jgi:pimeloyl-ACP methyl ester carboxylesterase